MSQRGALPQQESDCACFFFLSTAADMIERAAGVDQERRYWEIRASIQIQVLWMFSARLRMSNNVPSRVAQSSLQSWRLPPSTTRAKAMPAPKVAQAALRSGLGAIGGIGISLALVERGLYHHPISGLPLPLDAFAYPFAAHTPWLQMLVGRTWAGGPLRRAIELGGSVSTCLHHSSLIFRGKVLARVCSFAAPRASFSRPARGSAADRGEGNVLRCSRASSYA